jgi:hypothetical protein
VSVEERLPAPLGIPSITLLGTQKYWAQLMLKLDWMPEFGVQVAEYGKSVRPILLSFVRTFEDPSNLDIRRFWSDMPIGGLDDRTETVNRYPEPAKDGNLVTTGWISGFLRWDFSGDLLGLYIYHPGDGEETISVNLSGIWYPWIWYNQLPAGYITVRARSSVDSPSCAPAKFLAGMMGKRIRKVVPNGYAVMM